jgi:hypothetical protein
MNRPYRVNRKRDYFVAFLFFLSWLIIFAFRSLWLYGAWCIVYVLMIRQLEKKNQP